MLEYKVRFPESKVKFQRNKQSEQDVEPLILVVITSWMKRVNKMVKLKGTGKKCLISS